jgi:hypothetical protein
VESARARCDGLGDREQLTLAPEPSWEIEIGCDALG